MSETKFTAMKAPIYLRKEPVGSGAYLHDRFDKHLGYVSSAEVEEAIVAAVNSHAAKPDMLEALKAVRLHLSENPTGAIGWNATLNAAETAIIKAEGSQP